MKKLLRMWPALMVCGGAWFFGGLMIYLAITEGPNTPLLIAGIVCAAVPFVFILAGLLMSGVINPDRGLKLLELAFGLVAAGFGVLFISAMGRLSVIPAVFLGAGIFMIARSIFRK